MKKNGKLIIFILITIILLGLVIWKSFSKTNSKVEKENPVNIIHKNANLDEIEHNSNKLNIYLFWGDGCPHCKQEFEYLETLNEKYQDKINIYGFETWYNEENAKLMDDFANILGKEINSIPLTIIGNQYIVGYGMTTASEINKLIKEKVVKNDFDIYQEYLKLKEQ